MTDVFATSSWNRGLSEAEAQARLKTEGYNELPRQDRRTMLRIVFEVVREPMIALLLGGGVVYLALGDWREAVILLVFACLAIAITAVQETRTEHVLEALRDLTSPRALVIRDGERKRIPGREVARGDIIMLAEGDRVPADATLVECEELLVDESLLTGELAPVHKFASLRRRRQPRRAPRRRRLSSRFCRIAYRTGRRIAEVTATGPMSEIGRIGQSLGTLEMEPPRLQAQINRIVRMFGLVGLAVSFLAVALYGLLRGHWLNALLGGIALGMSMLPEEFPVVLAVFMAMGALRISRARVLTRRASAIEALGSATVLCTDKTGTLTENRMTVKVLRRPDGRALCLYPSADALVPEAFQDLIHVGVLASARRAVRPHGEGLSRTAAQERAGDGAAGERLEFVHVYGLRPDLLAVTQVWKPAAGGSKLVVASKGAPEAIAELCRFDGGRVDALKQSDATWRSRDCGFWASREPYARPETCQIRRAGLRSSLSDLSALQIRFGTARARQWMTAAPPASGS